MSADQRAAAARGLADTVANLAEFRDARHIAVYIAMDGEIDPDHLIARARTAGKTLYLPVLENTADGILEFAPWQIDTPLYPNRFNIPEPRMGTDLLRSAKELDLVLTPLVAFDSHGHRLGMGGGYYDRSFAFLNTGARKPRLIGLAYEFQQVSALPAEPWDVPLAGVACERGFHRFSA